MRHFRNMSAGLCMLLLAACVPFSSQLLRVQIPPSEPSTDTMIAIRTMTSSQAVGSFSYYRLVIYGDGTVVYEGQGLGVVEGRRTTRIDPVRVDALLYEFGKLDFFNLEGLTEDPTSEGTDDPLDYLFPFDLDDELPGLGTTVGLKIGDRYKAGVVTHLTPAPAVLLNLAHRILMETDAHRWVDGLTPAPVDTPGFPLPSPTP